MSTTTETKQLEKCNTNLIKEGDILSRTSYMIVGKTSKYSGVIAVKNEDGVEWQISNSIIEKECYTANQAEEEIQVSRTELIDIFSKVGDTICTVNFDKLPTADDFLTLTRGEGGKIRSFDEMTKDFKKFKGENRTIICYVIKVENGFGRSLVVQAFHEDEKGKKSFRQVDHRTLQWLIFKNKKYIVKK